MMFTSVIVSLALAASAMADMFMTSPTNATTFIAGQQATVSWQDSGSGPSLSQLGNVTFAIYVGNVLQQTLLQMIATHINVSSMSSFTFVPNATIGPNSGEYFIRCTSLTCKDPSLPQNYAKALSTRFTLTGMTGSFRANLQTGINDQSTAPIDGVTVSVAAGASQTAASTAASASQSSGTSPGSSGSTNSAGKSVIATSSVVLVAVLIGASLL